MSAHAVYRIFSEAGTPLYVGTTDRQWWEVVRVTHDDLPGGGRPRMYVRLVSETTAA